MITVTREMFDSNGPFYLDDFPIEDQKDQDRMFKLFMELPQHIQMVALTWGCSDTVFRDDAFVFLVEKYFNCTTEEYYKQGLNKKKI